MKALLNRIHERVGDLWWYSAMIFLACRSGDAIQAFIGSALASSKFMQLS